MVRFINQNFGENFNFESENKISSNVINQDQAKIAAQALLQQVMHSGEYHNESSNDSSTNSEAESMETGSEEEHTEGRLIIDGIIDDKTSEQNVKSDKDIKRKERRRERNKVSAQAYRQRRKSKTQTQEQVLHELEKYRNELLQKVNKLEEEKKCVEGFLKKHVKMPWHWHTYPCHCPCPPPGAPTARCGYPTTGQTTTTTPTGTMAAPMTMASTVEVS